MILAILLVAGSGCSTRNKEHTEYVPLWFDGNHLQVQESLRTKAHIDKVERVLTYYRIDYERVNELTIRFVQPMDDDYMWNMTSKAEDNEWLETHPINDGT